MIGDRELLSFRQGYYQMLVSLFWREPAGDLLAKLLEGIKERSRAARNLNALLAAGWEQMDRALTKTSAAQLSEEVAVEYTRLFIGPHGAEINPYESFYLTGRLLDRPLAEIRTVLKSLGIEKQDGYAEPEDFIAFELEVMHWLAEKQGNAREVEEEKRWIGHQAEFLKNHLLVWAPSCAEDIERAQGANFYRGVAKLLRGFLELERALFQEWGMDQLTSLEAARQRYGRVPDWKGPTFDMATGKSGEPSSEKKD
jgi:TorA maturation chaperone TorD